MPRPLQLDILVSLVGELRWGMEQALVTAYKISPVSCQAEFDAHLLEIAVLPLRLRKMQERAADIARAAFMGQDLTGVHNRNQLQTRSAQLLPNNVQHQVWINIKHYFRFWCILVFRSTLLAIGTAGLLELQEGF